jgi:hypothetical protein
MLIASLATVAGFERERQGLKDRFGFFSTMRCAPSTRSTPLSGFEEI